MQPFSVPASPNSTPAKTSFIKTLAKFLRRYLVVILITLFWSLSLRWWDGERMWGSHSPAFEPVRLMGVLDAWRHGIWDARWLPLFDQGYGYPIFAYHSPLFSWIGAVFLAITGLPVLSLKLTIMCFFVIGGLGCHKLASCFWARPGGRDHSAGNLAFAGWASATYLLTNIFVRGSLAEFAASSFFPWVLWGLWLGSRDSRRFLAGASVLASSLALLVLSHNAIAVYVIMLLVLPLPLIFRPAGWRGWFALASGGLAAGCLSAFFAVSAVLEKSFVRLDSVAIQDVRDHFLRVDHLLALSQWNLGLSGQDPACIMPRHQGALLPFALFTGVLAFCLYRVDRLRRKTLLALSLVMLTLLMAVPPSVWLWDHVRVLQFTQFPWRWLSLNATALALLVPALGIALKLHSTHIAQQTFAVAVAFILLLNIGLYGGPGVTWPRWTFDPRPELVQNDKNRTALSDEYGPIWRATEFEHTIAAGTAFAKNADVRPAFTANSPWRWSVGVRKEPSQIIVGINFFPGWKAYWTPLAGSAAQEIAVDKSDGLIQVTLPSGAPGVLELSFTNTPIRFWLKILSGTTLVAGIALFLGLRRRASGAQPVASVES